MCDHQNLVKCVPRIGVVNVNGHDEVSISGKAGSQREIRDGSPKGGRQALPFSPALPALSRLKLL